jgi:hypothetical protein
MLCRKELFIIIFNEIIARGKNFLAGAGKLWVDNLGGREREWSGLDSKVIS